MREKKSALHHFHCMVAVGLLAINSAGDVQPATSDVLGRTLGTVKGFAAYGPTLKCCISKEKKWNKKSYMMCGGAEWRSTVAGSC